MSIRQLLEYIADNYTLDDVLYILGKDNIWFLNKIRAEIIAKRKDFIEGDDYYTELYND